MVVILSSTPLAAPVGHAKGAELSRFECTRPGPPLQVELELEHNFCWRPHSQYLQFWWHLGFAQLGAGNQTIRVAPTGLLPAPSTVTVTSDAVPGQLELADPSRSPTLELDDSIRPWQVCYSSCCFPVYVYQLETQKCTSSHQLVQES